MAIPSPKVWYFAAAIVAVAAASLALPFALAYDPWAWLVWGRELGALDLDTGAGPSWKPLPALVAVPLSLAGDAAPELWQVVARAGWIAAAALAWRLAALLAIPEGDAAAAGGAEAGSSRARVAAGAIAAAGIVLLFDPFTSWTRQFAIGLSEPLLVALLLGAIERHVRGAWGQALGLVLLAALLRPETWPFLAVYVAWLWRDQPELRRAAVAAAVAAPVLWLVPDLIGSGDPLTGAERAREATGSALGEGIEAVGRALELPLAALWPAAAFAVISARRTGERAIGALAAAGLAWIAVVGVLAAAGYAGLPRFAAPAGALVCVVGAVGVVRLARVAAVRSGVLGAALVLLVAGLVVQAGFRVADIPGELDGAADSGSDVDDMFAAVDRAGASRVDGCGPVTTSDYLTQPALAWKLERPLDGVSVRIESAPTAGTMLLDADASATARAAVTSAGTPIAASGRWRVYAISCAASASSPRGRPIAGVAGARR